MSVQRMAVDTGGVIVLVTISNELRRFGIERMMEALGRPVRFRNGADVEWSLAEVRDDPATVLVVSYAEVRGHERSVRRAIDAGAKVLVLFGEREGDRLADLTSGHRGGYLCVEELDAPTLADALAQVSRGGFVMSARLARDLLASAGGGRPAAATARLSRRERQVLDLLVEGLSNKQIARRLEISDHGAKRLVAVLMAKLDSPSRTVVVAKALREGLLNGGA
jgi:two-component system nitrate/nitrite response regulator NarL